MYNDLKIYDASGKFIKVLMSDKYVTGHHKVFWDGKDENDTPCAPGLYFCRLETPEYFDVMKIIKLE